MKIEELIQKLQKLAELNGDKEIAHREADKLLLEYINNLMVTETFESIGKWYA